MANIPDKYKNSYNMALKCPDFIRDIFNPVNTPELSTEILAYQVTIANKFYSVNSRKVNFWYELGYKQVGLMHLGFSYWLIDMLKKNKSDKIFFLARDGHILKRIYDFILSSNPELAKELPPSYYLYASRRSMHIPSLADNDDDDVLKYLHCRLYGLKVSQFLEKIDFDPAKYTDIIKQAGFKNKNDKITGKEDFDKVSKLYNLIYKDLKSLAKSEKETLVKYLEKAGIFDTKNIAVVDIGWGASLQNSLDKIIRSLGIESNIKGYYLGTFKTAQEIISDKNSVAGYLFNFDKPEQVKNIVMQCVELFEFFHTAPHGSVVRFRENLEPVFDLDCDQDKIKKGMEVQRGVLDFIKDFQEIQKDFEEINISGELAIKPISRVIMNPIYQEAVMLGNLTHVDGHINTKRCIARPPDLISSIINPSGYEEEYMKCYWKLGFLKRWFNKKTTDNSQDLVKLNMLYYLNRNSVKKRVKSFIKENKDKKICFYGAGQFAQEFLKIYDLSDLNVLGFIDNNPDKAGKMIGNYKIYPPDSIAELAPDILVLMILDKEKILPFINTLLKENNYELAIIADLIS